MVWCTSKGFSCQWVNDVPLDATWNWWDWRATRKRNDEKCLQWHQRKQGTIRNTRSKKKRGYRFWNHLVQIFGIARVKYSQVLSKSQIFWITCNIGSTSCSGKSGHKTCEQQQEDINGAIRWLRKRGQVVESVIQTATICPRKENSRVNLCHCYSGPFELTEKHPKVPINWNNRNRQGFCACRFWSVIEESWGSSRLVIQIVAAKHVQSTQW